jgi:anthranilate synthase component 1
MFYMDMGELGVLLGTSPEIMLRKEGEILTIRPIAGTRKRGRTPEQDDAIAKELLADEKENAEHIMLVDLARNDLNRVADPQTVKIEAYQMIERYSHVMHIVSSVTGTMRADQTAISAIKATFPAGTLSGAPKVRAMQIIAELEPEPRGTYGGLVGYFGLNGQFDSCITIRSVRVHEGQAHVQVGAGIVADSDPTQEYEETINKARAMLKAIERAKG